MAAMTAEELRAAIEATRRQTEAEEARGAEITVEIAHADERWRLRRELEQMRGRLEHQQTANESQERHRRSVDEDRGRPYVEYPPRKPHIMKARGGTSINCADTVVRGEHVWRIEGFSWLRGMLKQRQQRFVCSLPFDLGDEMFYFVYSPWEQDLCRQQHQHGSLAILLSTEECLAIRYSIYVKAWNGEFVQWGETCNVVHFGSSIKISAYGPDVHLDGHPPASVGIFGLSHEELLQSEWVDNDTLVVKFELEVRPDGGGASQPLSLVAEAEVPEPTILEEMQALLKEGTCSDVRFMVQGEEIEAHSQVLCARSEVLSKQLTAGMQESVSKVITIEDCDAATFRAFLQFLYTDHLPDARSEQSWDDEDENANGSLQLSLVQELLSVSHKYQVKRLQAWCEATLAEEVNASQVCDILCQAHLLQAKRLEQACLSFIKDNPSRVLTLPAYVELAKKWPEIGLKVHLFTAGVSETEDEKPQEQESEPASE
ncbi:BTB/POZ and MATH domain-containing protein 1 [Symbiodinium microadriaticum]|uniref:BTB/POZ and MATH domain-containing protein 1 n=1 Tax=Symbiodinium microadriaticum TaxID=2951 RepID=A0A1Q9C566_SYMMI|nr:BTB/POZ and MATH domain-containing protein 1 [Symbiodinium microadriaticum]